MPLFSERHLFSQGTRERNRMPFFRSAPPWCAPSLGVWAGPRSHPPSTRPRCGNHPGSQAPETNTKPQRVSGCIFTRQSPDGDAGPRTPEAAAGKQQETRELLSRRVPLSRPPVLIAKAAPGVIATPAPKRRNAGDFKGWLLLSHWAL